MVKRKFLQKIVVCFVLSGSISFHAIAQMSNVVYSPGIPFSGAGVALPPLNTSFEVGSTEGAFNVSESGSANYTVPFTVPPGTGGMQPQLSIVYNSDGGDGLLGTGWMLTGFSNIGRTTKNLYNDNEVAPINLSNNDPFTLDGSRLIPINGNNGLNGTTYGTENEKFQFIQSHGAVGSPSCPAYFTVETQDGILMEYGNTPDSYIEAVGSNLALTWLLNKVKDTKTGNYYTIQYYENTLTGEFRPEYINYTANDGAGLTSYNQIKLTYGLRNAAHFQGGYNAGSVYQQAVLLTKMEMLFQSAMVHEYNFNYSFDMATHLNEVVEKDNTGKQYNSTRFSWQNNYSLDPVVYSSAYFNNNLGGEYIAADINGDGFSDVVVLENDNWAVHINNINDGGGVTYSIPQNGTGSGSLTNSSGKGVAGDFNGDGNDDIIIFNLSGLAYYYRSDGTTLMEGYFSPIDLAPYVDGFTVGDFNGDGKTDFFTCNATGDWKIHSTGSSSTSDFSLIAYGGNNSLWGSGQNPVFYAVDMNGDGKQEIMQKTDGDILVNEFNGNNLQNIHFNPGTQLRNADNIYPADFNGDGKIDLLTWRQSGSTGWKIWHSTGKAFVESAIIPQLLNVNPDDNNIKTKFFVSDFSGDGKADIIQLRNDAGMDVRTLYNLGNSFLENNIHFNFDYHTSSANLNNIIGDFNADGHMDLLYRNCVSSQQNAVFLQLQPNTDIHKIREITNGLNKNIVISYATLTGLYASGAYTKDNSGGSLPSHTINFKYPKSMIFRVQEKIDESGSYSDINYTYHGAKLHLRGRGFLGFLSNTVSNITTGIKTVTTNTINNFYENVPVSVATSLVADGTAISQKSFIYNSLIDLGDKRHETYVSESTDVDHLRNVTTTNTFQMTGGRLTLKTISQPGITSTTTNNYQLLGGSSNTYLLINSAASATRAAEVPYNRSKAYTYNALGQLLTESEMGLTTTTYGYSGTYHDVVSVTTTGSDIPTSVLTYSYDPLRRFITSQTNALGHIQTSTYDNIYGRVLTETTPNILTTTNLYDGFGRLIQTTSPTGQVTTVSRTWDNSVQNSVYKVQTSSTGKPTLKEYFDLEGKLLRTQKTGFDGTMINIDKNYNNKGLITSETSPYFSGSTPLNTTYTYMIIT